MGAATNGGKDDYSLKIYENIDCGVFV